MPIADMKRLRDALLVVKRDLADVEGTAGNDAGTITATVDGRGELRELVLDQRIYRNINAAALSADILETIRAAAQAAAAEAYQLTTKALR